jgi:hypothetical protein
MDRIGDQQTACLNQLFKCCKQLVDAERNMIQQMVRGLRQELR